MRAGVFISSNTSALMGAAPRHRQGIASGILATARNVGMVLGVGLAGAVLATVQAQRQAGGSPIPFFDGIRAGFLVASVVAVLGVLTSVVRGKSVDNDPPGQIKTDERSFPSHATSARPSAEK